MKSVSGHGGRRGVFLAAAATALLVALGATLIVSGLTTTPGSAPNTPAESTAADRTSPTPYPSPAGPANGTATNNPPPGNQNARANATPRPEFLPGSPPVSLHIPAIAVRSTTIVGLGLQDDGSIEVPKDPDRPGWFTPGPSPGQLGPSVIAGHVDSNTGPAIFYRLGELRQGDRVQVTRADGTTATFVIDQVTTYDKDEFPTRAVYGPTDRAELRLITCSGDYNEKTGYDSNTVAFAHLL